jgi:hypothetical protein
LLKELSHTGNKKKVPAKLFPSFQKTDPRMKKIIPLILANAIMMICTAQQLYVPREISRAYDKGTRSYDGRPGSAYFQNRVNYSIDAEFNPGTRLIRGSEKISYQNNSPYALRYVVVRLYQNIFKQGGVRGRPVDPADTNNGMKITSLTIRGKKCDLETDQCILRESQTTVVLPFNCGPGSEEEIEIGWEFTMPSRPNDRFGGYNDNTFFMGYWFPQISVFDDINGWDIFDYNGVAEFYNEFGNFDVRINVPSNYIVWGTGILQNPEEVLSVEYLERYRKACEISKEVEIITSGDRKSGKIITAETGKPWHFTAENVSDFAFGTSSTYIWDGCTITDKQGKKILIQSAYDPGAQNFDKVLDLIHWSIDELEADLPGIPYPYPAMTAFNGNGGMEYPMMINDHDGSLVETIFVTSHEVAHTYFPFLVGTNQRRHGWMDEGLVTMMGMEVHFKKDSTMNLMSNYVDYYSKVAGTQMDVPPIVNSIYLSDNIFQLHEYTRSSLAFRILEDIMGKEAFRKCINEFASRWEGKHPTPWDLFYTINNVTGEDYSRYFQAWFNSYSYPDLSVKEASYENDTLSVKLENTGGMPFPSTLRITWDNGTTTEKFLSGKEWLASPELEIKIPSGKRPEGVLLNTRGYPDNNEANNSFRFPSR